jgi:hypothetical protein
MKNPITITQAVKQLYTCNPSSTVKEMVQNLIEGQWQSVNYRQVYNALKRIKGSSGVPKAKKSSIIFDLSAPPAYTVRGILVKRGKHCK